MPIFEYECTQCGKHTEHLQLSAASALVECPHCGSPVKKLMSAPAFQFKGSGWYVTDYANKGKQPEKTAGGESAEASSASKTDTGSGKSDSSAKSSGDSKTSSTQTSSVKASSPSD